jgi:uncharacterized phage protein (TIGR02218 family)
VHRLVYVRFTDDKEAAENLTEGRQRRQIRVVELPEEYETAETGEEPVFLYRFYQVIDGTETSWHFTSFAEDIVSGGTTYTARNLNHGAIRRSVATEQETVDVSAMFDVSAPWADDMPNPSTWPLWVEIMEAQFATPDTRTVVFTGREDKSPRVKGRRFDMTFASWVDSFDSRVPHMLFGPLCPFHLYDPATCKVDPTSYQVDVTLFAIRHFEVIVAVTSSFAANYFQNGKIRFGTGASTQYRNILANTPDSGGYVLLTLNGRPPASAASGDAVSIWPGCDKTNGAGGCPKFSNDRFAGTPFVPRTNLTLKAVEVSSSGGKKGG